VSGDVGRRLKVSDPNFVRIISFCDRETLRKTVHGRRFKYDNKITYLWFTIIKKHTKYIIFVKIESSYILLMPMTDTGTSIHAKFSYRQTDEMRVSVIDI
jgi:hypothetical protein